MGGTWIEIDFAEDVARAETEILKSRGADFAQAIGTGRAAGGKD